MIIFVLLYSLTSNYLTHENRNIGNGLMYIIISDQYYQSSIEGNIYIIQILNDSRNSLKNRKPICS